MITPSLLKLPRQEGNRKGRVSELCLHEFLRGQDESQKKGVAMRLSRILLSILCVLSIGGCQLLGAKKDIKKIEEYIPIEGVVHDTSAQTGPVIVVLIRKTSEKEGSIDGYWVMHKEGTFRFRRREGDYYVYAFKDFEQDRTFNRNEYVGWHGDPTLLHIRPDEPLMKLDITLLPPEKAIELLPDLYSPRRKPRKVSLEDRNFGVVASIDNPDFTAENGELGFWNPVQFMEQADGGLYFLEPYTDEKTPVLFVHGASGHPKIWRSILEGLDRTKFQPWVFFYPSGLRLALIGEFLNHELNELHAMHKFNQLFVVAHSMGGLVCRSLINQHHNDDYADYITLFTSISTPWGGHRCAVKGVTKFPVIVPCWYDMVPDSPFLVEIFETPLPSSTSFYLLFGYKGNVGVFAGGNSDGVIGLNSLLRKEAQEIASQTRGFDADHVMILSNAELVKTLNDILLDNLR